MSIKKIKAVGYDDARRGVPFMPNQAWSQEEFKAYREGYMGYFEKKNEG